MFYLNEEQGGNSDVFFYNNTLICAADSQGGINVVNMDGNDIYVQNNIISGPCITTSINLSATSDGNMIGGYNIMENHASANDEAGGGTYTNTDSADIGSTDPLLVSSSDFHLTAQSLAMDSGTYLSGYDKCLTGDFSDWVNTVQLVSNKGMDGMADRGAMCFPKYGGD